MSGSETLADWLRRQLDEDERMAQAAIGAQISAEVEWGHEAVLHHINRWSSKRVLAEVAAKRALLDRLQVVDHYDMQLAQEWGSPKAGLADEMLRLLAAPFRGVPGWREEWDLEV